MHAVRARNERLVSVWSLFLPMPLPAKDADVTFLGFDFTFVGTERLDKPGEIAKVASEGMRE